MKCKRIFKVVSALALTVALLVSTGVVSLAAASYTTTTTYLNQDTIEVTSVASGLETGDMATYVAYNGNEGFSANSAVYIDQATAVTGKDIVFDYQTSSDNVKATVKFGGSTVANPDVVNIDDLGYDITIDLDGDTKSVTVPEAVANYPDEYLAREIDVKLPEGKAIASVTVDGEEVPIWYVKEGKLIIYSFVEMKDGSVVKITTAQAAVNVKLGTVKAEEGKITAFAKATCAQDANYGIIIAKGANANLDATSNWNTAKDYEVPVTLPALGMGNDGGFCVEVEDAAIVAGDYTVAAYAAGVKAKRNVTIAVATTEE